MSEKLKAVEVDNMENHRGPRTLVDIRSTQSREKNCQTFMDGFLSLSQRLACILYASYLHSENKAKTRCNV